MEKIVFINQWASYITKDIINAFAEKHKNVALIAGNISESGSKLNSSIRINRIIRYNKRNIFTRAVTWIVATIQIIFIINTRYKGFHLFLTSNPPTASFIPMFCNNSYSVQILDIYPDALLAGKFIKSKSFLLKLWERRNVKYFRGAKNIFTISDGMAKTISKYITPEKITVINQWPAIKGIGIIDKELNNFIQKHSLNGKFIVMYSGNIGLGHHVSSLIESANILKAYKDIIFVIIGEGWNKPVIEKMIKDYALNNCLLLPFQPVEMFRHSLQAADIGVVSVSKEMANLSIPVKTYNLISHGIPLMAITEGESELSNLVDKFNIGKSFAFNEINGMTEFILSLYKNKDFLHIYRNNLKVCAEEFSPANAYKYPEKFIF